MRGPLQSIIIALFVAASGAAWLLDTMHVLSSPNWVFPLALIVMGGLILGLGGINKLTLVIGPFLISAALLSFLGERGAIASHQQLPLLVTVVGVMMLFTSVARIPPAGSRMR